MAPLKRPKLLYVFRTKDGTVLCTEDPGYMIPTDTLLGEYVPRRKRKPKPVDNRTLPLYTPVHDENNGPATTESAVLDLGTSEAGEHKQEANA